MAEPEIEETEGFDQNLFKPSFVLVAIDADPSMFIKNEESTVIPFRSCLKACSEIANSLIFNQNQRSWCPFGVVFALEDSTKASFINFNDNILDSIKLLQNELKLPDETLQEKYERKSLDLSAFFLFCKKKFKEVKVFYKHTLIFISNDDNPVPDPKQRFAALNEAKNFKANDLFLDFVTMNPNFDYKLFYNELYSVMKLEAIESFIEDEEGLLEKLSSSIVAKTHKRKLAFYPFLGNKKKYLKVIQKKIIRDEKLYCNAFRDQKGEALKKVIGNFDDKISSSVYNLEPNTENFEFTIEEVNSLFNTEIEIGYTLVYVSKRYTDIGFVLKDPLLLEADPKEDLPFFNSYWQFCVDNDKVLICARRLRQNDKIRFVELIPKFANNTKFFIIQAISFADEIEHPETAAFSQNDEHEVDLIDDKVEIMQMLIEKLSFDYSPQMFSDPENAKLKAFLKSKLLNEAKEEVADVTLDNEAINNCLGDIVSRFNDLFEANVVEKGTKRGRNTSAGTSKRRK